MGDHVAGLLYRLRVAVVLSESVGHMHRAPPASDGNGQEIRLLDGQMS